MKLNQPKFITWLIAVILGVLGIIANYVPVDFLNVIGIWIVVVGLALLAIANVVKGL